MSNIISDISKRVLVVKGTNEVRRISDLNQGRDIIIKIRALQDDVWEIELIYRVGDYQIKDKVGGPNKQKTFKTM